jgi:hypothetical protein
MASKKSVEVFPSILMSQIPLLTEFPSTLKVWVIVGNPLAVCPLPRHLVVEIDKELFTGEHRSTCFFFVFERETIKVENQATLRGWLQCRVNSHDGTIDQDQDIGTRRKGVCGGNECGINTTFECEIEPTYSQRLVRQIKLLARV